MGETSIEQSPFHKRLRDELVGVIQGETDLIANTGVSPLSSMCINVVPANISAVLFELLNEDRNKSINWAGFYFVRTSDTLVLGPFQGPASLHLVLPLI